MSRTTKQKPGARIARRVAERIMARIRCVAAEKDSLQDFDPRALELGSLDAGLTEAWNIVGQEFHLKGF
jgi:hypothetical protein